MLNKHVEIGDANLEVIEGAGFFLGLTAPPGTPGVALAILMAIPDEGVSPGAGRLLLQEANLETARDIRGVLDQLIAELEK